jgi:hypothetical protein
MSLYHVQKLRKTGSEHWYIVGKISRWQPVTATAQEFFDLLLALEQLCVERQNFFGCRNLTREFLSTMYSNVP